MGRGSAPPGPALAGTPKAEHAAARTEQQLPRALAPPQVPSVRGPSAALGLRLAWPPSPAALSHSQVSPARGPLRSPHTCRHVGQAGGSRGCSWGA